ncbi:MAG: valine--tRNA ligase [Nanoarchaeota archaeon]|nr:valine--tRNA ligase [Nanoarchaeota archaeon]
MPDLDFKAIESQILKLWEKEKVYSFNPKSKKKIFSIDTPPPTVSGKMHVGHSFSYSQQDFIARFKRMSGFEVFYPFGTDDNGLPTERLIEKTKNVKSKSMSRADFISLCLKTLKEITPDFVQDWKNLGISCDYNLAYSTIDKNSQKISQQSFIDLYKKGRIYREKFPTIYCPECQTPVAQAELEDKQKSAFFTTLKFKVQNQDLPIATTRPELLGACVAVFVNPEDKRYKNFIGKKAIVPLFNHEVPIIADNSAQIEKGTGVLMICSYGDKYDVEAIKRHKLTPRIILNKEGKLTISPFQNIPIKSARNKILETLKNNNLIIEQKTIEHSVNVHDKCGTEIEFIPLEAWFIKILDKKLQLIAQGKKIKWHPEHMFKRYENWIQGLEWDWSISRDRHFGIPIPVWICEKCNEILIPKESDLPIDPIQIKKDCPKCKSPAQAETKVLDTWATSSLTPQLGSSLVNNKIKIPYSLRPQSHDIIRTWGFYTIAKSLLHENQIPWKEIAISGFVTLGGEKMSKSKGNVISPQTIMDNYGSDALRYWASTSKLGEDLDYQEKDIITGKKFINKILNATKFVFMNLQYQKTQPKLIETDRLFLSHLNNIIKSTTESFEEYNYSKAKLDADSFFWKSFADNYLEIIKNRVYQGTEEEKASAFYTLYHSLLTILKLYAPLTPFITEHLYQEYLKQYEKISSIHISPWPVQIKIKTQKSDQESWISLIETLSKIRQAKSEAKKSMNSPIILSLPKETLKSLSPCIADLKAVTASQKINEGEFKVEFAQK